MKRRTRTTEQALRVLLDAGDEWTYGLQIAKTTGLRSGSLYPILMRLERTGWAESRWETEHEQARPRRRFYRLTEFGRAEALALFATDPARVSRYRRRGTYVEAICWLGTNWEAVHEFVGDAVHRDGDVLWIATPDAPERAPLGYWVIRGVKNFFPVDQETFDAMFEVP